MEAIFKFIEQASKYGFPIPLALLVLGFGFWIASTTKWPEREKYYYHLLSSLGKWQDSLEALGDYYMEPGSEYRDDQISLKPRFKILMDKGTEAHEEIRQELHVARLFLSPHSVKLLEDMLGEHWFIQEMDAVCIADYLAKTVKLATCSYNAILFDAKKDLKRSKYLILINQFIPK